MPRLLQAEPSSMEWANALKVGKTARDSYRTLPHLRRLTLLLLPMALLCPPGLSLGLKDCSC